MRTALLLLIVSCGYANAPASYPDRGPFVQVANTWNIAPLKVTAVDGMGRQLVLGVVLHDRTGCWRWPWVDADGVLIVGRDTLTFRPWTKPGWRVDPVTHVLEATKGFCP